MSTPDAVDQSGSKIDPVWARAHGVLVIYGYLDPGGWKDCDAAYVRRCHAAGVGVFLGKEDGAQDALGGAPAGARQGLEARQAYDTLIAQVGYAPRSRVAIAPSFDFDTDPEMYAAIDAYARAFLAQLAGTRYDMGDYGEADLVDHLHAIGLVHSGEFGTYAWSRGHVSAYADLQQYANGQTLDGASVDFDRVYHLANLGAWWPPNHPLDQPTTTEDDDMQTLDALRQYLAGGVAPGQKSVGSTIAATLQTVQATFNNGRVALGALAAIASSQQRIEADLAALKAKVGA